MGDTSSLARLTYRYQNTTDLSPQVARHSLRRGAGGCRLGEESLGLSRRRVAGSKQCLEVLDGKPGVFHNTGHGECLHGVVAWHGHEPFSVAHDHVLPLPDDPETSFFERTYRVEMVDPRNSRHV